MNIRNLVLAMAALAVAVPLNAHAAPQMLGVIATKQPLPMTCADGVCVAELSTFCLQKKRPSPTRGTGYAPFDAAHFEIVITDATGGNRTLETGEMGFAFTAERGFTAVEAQLDADELARLGAVSASVVVVEGATLIPMPTADDTDPLSAHEIAYFAGTLRDKARTWLSDADERTAALQTIATIINSSAAADANERSPETAVTVDPAALPAGAPMPARAIYEGCQARVAQGWSGLGSCLKVQHDVLMQQINNDYWNGVEAGS